MRSVHSGPLLAPAGVGLLLAVLAVTVGLEPAGWVVGAGCGLAVGAGLSRGLSRSAADRLGPADAVTLARAVLSCAVAALVADGFTRSVPVALLVTLAAVALVLDGVDGHVARRTGTSSELGARFDMEVDAFLILVLSVHVSRSIGAWVLAIGAARYAFVAAGWLLPWLRAPLPPRYWRKVVAATQGVVLVSVASALLPRTVALGAVVLALGLLTESFGRDVGWLWRRRAGSGAARRAGPGATRWLAPTLAVLLVWTALVAPDEARLLTPAAFARLPIEAAGLVLLALVVPVAARRLTAIAVGLSLALLVLVRLLDMTFRLALGRPFDPLTDWRYFGSAEGLLRQSVGRANALTALVSAVVLGVVLLLLLPLAVLRVMRLAAAHRSGSLRAAAATALVWSLCAALQLQLAPGAPIAAATTSRLAADQVSRLRADVEDGRRFAAAAANDPFRDALGPTLLTGLRGKDVIVVFVESYGRVAIQGPGSADVVATLDAGTDRLRAAGFDSRSAFLTSPTFGGLSWLAHSTLQSGLWIDDQRRYDDVVSSGRFTLSAAFHRAGWRTVAMVPSNERAWPTGSAFYHYDATYDAHNVGYAGPRFSYATMPDQYVLSAFRRLELDRPDRGPVMAEVDLVSSHTPWSPLPRMVDWDAVGDGSAFDPMPAQGARPGSVWHDPTRMRAAYRASIHYSLSTLISFVLTSGDPDLVLVVLGDHQPATIVSGQDAGHDVPVTLVAHDPAVLDLVSGWGWQAGLRPHAGAPVWPMDAFRDRFLVAFGPARAAPARGEPACCSPGRPGVRSAGTP